MVLILTQSYTASLASMLTVQQLKPEFVDVKEIKRNDYFVGYHNDSFVRELLIKQFNIDESKLKPYRTPEEDDEALSNGTHNGGVAAIFDEIPYIKLFLSKYGSRYAMVGPIYKTDGFGFVSIYLNLSYQHNMGKKNADIFLFRYFLYICCIHFVEHSIDPDTFMVNVSVGHK